MSRSGLLALFQMVLLRDWPERYGLKSHYDGEAAS
jgi:hypothetical protein